LGQERVVWFLEGALETGAPLLFEVLKMATITNSNDELAITIPKRRCSKKKRKSRKERVRDLLSVMETQINRKSG